MQKKRLSLNNRLCLPKTLFIKTTTEIKEIDKENNRTEENSPPPSFAEPPEDESRLLGARPKTKRGLVSLDLKEKIATEMERLDKFLTIDRSEITDVAFEPLAFISKRKDFLVVCERTLFVFNKIGFFAHFSFALIGCYLNCIPQVLHDLLTFQENPLNGFEFLSNLIIEKSSDISITRAGLKLKELGEEFKSSFQISNNFDPTEISEEKSLQNNPASKKKTKMIFIKGKDADKIRQSMASLIGRIAVFLNYCEELEEVVTVAARVEQTYRKHFMRFDLEDFYLMCEILKAKAHHRLVSDFFNLNESQPFEYLFEDLKSFRIEAYQAKNATGVYLNVYLKFMRQFASDETLPDF